VERLLAWLGINTAGNQAAVLEGLTAILGVALTVGVTAWIAVRTWTETARLERERRDAESDREQSRRDTDRAERREDLARAIRAEAEVVGKSLRVFGTLEQKLAGARKRFAEARRTKEKYTPFATSSIGTIIGHDLPQELVLLDRDQVAVVVAFYRQVKVVEDFAADLRSEGFAALSLERKERMLLHYISMEEEVIAEAEKCVAILSPGGRSGPAS
jgi:hypothetical protein